MSPHEQRAYEEERARLAARREAENELTPEKAIAGLVVVAIAVGLAYVLSH